MLKRSLLLGALLTLLLVAPAPAKLLYVGDKGVATVGKLTCPAASACRVAAPKRVKAKIAAKPVWAKVLAPQRIAPRKQGTVRVKLGAGALGELAGRTTTVKVKAVLRRQGKALTKVLRVRLRRAALAGQPSGPGGPPTSGPLGNEPPRLARPATASSSPAVRSGSTRRPPNARTGPAPAMRSCPTGSTSRRKRAGMTRSAGPPASTAPAPSPSAGRGTGSTSPRPTRRSRSTAPPRGRSSASRAAAALPIRTSARPSSTSPSTASRRSPTAARPSLTAWCGGP